MANPLPSVIARLGARESLHTARLALKERLVETDPWYDSDEQSGHPGVFVLGCGRSGTTMLREMLVRHSRLGGGPETSMLSDLVNFKRLSQAFDRPESDLRALAQRCDSIVSFTDRFLAEYLEKVGKPRWVEKTPRNARVLWRLLHQFPNGRFIHIMRDGRDVSCSLRNFRTHRLKDGRVVARRQARVTPIADCARRWVKDTSTAHALASHPNVIEVRYEDIVDNPAYELTRLCDFVGEQFEPAMLEESKRKEGDDPGRFVNNPRAAETVQKTRKERWRKDLSPPDRAVVNRIAGGLLIALGYAEDDSWASDGNSGA
jgi:hypothetical protein